jgi:hypothetical protein
MKHIGIMLGKYCKLGGKYFILLLTSAVQTLWDETADTAFKCDKAAKLW